MYRGFNLSVHEETFSTYLTTGIRAHASHKQKVASKIASFFNSKGVLDASKVIANWFPEIESDVFISHSHKDGETAIGLSGWLQSKFGLTAFIDSCVWGYSDDLLRMLDEKYCRIPGSKSFSYEKRNLSTTHVHMMLSTALSKMMNNCECLIFLNTPASISSEDYINGDTTNSPWIYSEIAMTRLIQKRTPGQHRRTALAKALEILEESLQVEYQINLGHLTKLTVDHLNDWMKKCPSGVGYEALDVLYQIS